MRPLSREPLRTVCHIVAIESGTQRIAASITPSGWLLPTAIFPARTTHAAMLLQAASALPMPAIPRCLVFPHIDRSSESIDYMLIVDLVRNGTEHAIGTAVVDVTTLLRDEALVPYQQTAMRLLVAASGDPRSLARQPRWLHQVIAWARPALGLAGDTKPWLVKVDVYRATDQLIVLTLIVDGRLVHFKSSLANPFVEARVTQLLASLTPEIVIPTLAFDAARGWWLTHHAEGVPLTADLWPAHLEAVAIWRHLQAIARPHHQALQDAGVPWLDRPALLDAACHAISTAKGDSAILDRVMRLLDTETYRAAPVGLLHFDAAPRNILRSSRGCRFLDLESACLGPATLAGELMTRQMKHDLPPAQLQPLSRATLDDPSTPAEHVRALTDLCLLAYHRRRLFNNLQQAIDTESLHYTSMRLAIDFLNRANSWHI